MPSKVTSAARQRTQATASPTKLPLGERQDGVASIGETAPEKKSAGSDDEASWLRANASSMFQAGWPMLASWGMTVSLILGGCCSNVRRSTLPISYKDPGADEL